MWTGLDRNLGAGQGLQERGERVDLLFKTQARCMRVWLNELLT